MMDNNAADALLSIPMHKSIPGTISASAIGTCITAGKPILSVKKTTKSGCNFIAP